MNTVVSDIVTWVRRLLKLPNPEDILDMTILDYLNRFIVYDVSYRIQLFELRTTYTFELQPNVDRYNMPFDTYNSILAPAYCDGVQIAMSQTTNQFQATFYKNIFNQTLGVGSGANNYSYTIPQAPFIRGFVDGVGTILPGIYVTAQDVNGNNLVLSDNGTIANNVGNLVGNGSGTVNYLTGALAFSFTTNIPGTSNINCQTIPYTAGQPSAVQFYQNVFTVRQVPDKAYLMQFDAYYTPSAFLDTAAAVPYGWMAEYFAHGTARKILKDFGDINQLTFLEPFFKELEHQVLRRTTRQNANSRRSSIYDGQNSGSYNTGGWGVNI